ncbi:hypothetical protein OUY22_23005 [Nonomuraea sp. MCN248]|uniref:DUF3598 domain-containing protein n=1 Tax=Nonomuraea corallina TaxID=2989783 RepID=A0ABT4SGG7_9ACTN|nr:hypothetical protein [Nonomuraea corallina]MDA0636301.1 hypothetical protein [Nonomuraea corallina]
MDKHLGEWRGEYIHIDADGTIVDRHSSHLYCRIPEDGAYNFIQTNTYTWDDGRQQVFDFGGRIEGGIGYFDTERITGEMSQVDDQTIVLTWSYKDDPDNYLYELIQLSRDGKHKCRTWHWMNGDRLVKRTIISETKVA